jgi:hypothetical protein
VLLSSFLTPAASAGFSAPEVVGRYSHQPYPRFDDEQCVLCGKPGYMDAASMTVSRLNDEMIRVDFYKSNGWSDGSVELSFVSGDETLQTYRRQLSDSRNVYVLFFADPDGKISARVQYSKRVSFITSWNETAFRSFQQETP